MSEKAPPDPLCLLKKPFEEMRKRFFEQLAPEPLKQLFRGGSKEEKKEEKRKTRMF